MIISNIVIAIIRTIFLRSHELKVAPFGSNLLLDASMRETFEEQMMIFEEHLSLIFIIYYLHIK
jgi:hypothetical protein